MKGISQTIKDEDRKDKIIKESTKNLIGRLAGYLKESYPEVLEGSPELYKEDWANGGDKWKDVVIEYMIRYEKSMSDIHALGRILLNLKKYASKFYIFEKKAPQMLMESNPFKRPKIDKVWEKIYTEN